MKFFSIFICFLLFLLFLDWIQHESTMHKMESLSYLDNMDCSKKKERSKKMTLEELRKEENPYFFDTVLTNGYHLAFSYYEPDTNAEVLMCICLKKGEKIIDTLNMMGWAAPIKNLGYLGEDFHDYFIFVNSYGSGNPHEMRLIRKLDGKTIKSGFIVDTYKKPELVLYAKGADSLMLYNIAKNKDFFLENLEKSKDINIGISQLHEGIKIQKIHSYYLILEILKIGNLKNATIRKKYFLT